MSKKLTLAALILSLTFSSGCTVVVHRSYHRIETRKQLPQQELPQSKPAVGPETGATISVFRFLW